MSDTVMIDTDQYLTFTLDKEPYALEISTVHEVLEFSNVTHVPRTPEYMLGVINLRGNVVPVVDLKLKLGMSKTNQTVDTRNLIKVYAHSRMNLSLSSSATRVPNGAPSRSNMAWSHLTSLPDTRFKQKRLICMGVIAKLTNFPCSRSNVGKYINARSLRKAACPPIPS